MWLVKAVDEMCGDGALSYEEANERFGLWMYGVSYGSCFELRERVVEYLSARGPILC